MKNSETNSFSVYWQQPIEIAIEFEVLEQVEEVALGAGIRALDGTAVFTVHHDDEGVQPLLSFEPGRYVVEFTLQNDLRPGLYRLHVGADREHIMMANIFAVEPVILEVFDHTKEGFEARKSHTGLFNGSSTWKPPQRLD